MVGERGSEYVRLPRGADVYPNGTAPRGYDDDRVLRRLEAIEQRLIEAPAQYAQQTLGGMRVLGQEQAKMQQRLVRKA